MKSYIFLKVSLVFGLFGLTNAEAETLSGESSIQAEIFLDSATPPLIPAPGPDEVVEFPESDAEFGPLAIRYVSDLDFGLSNVKQKKETIYLPFDRGVSGGNAHNSVIIQDYSGNLNGWSLEVQIDTEHMKGAILKFVPEWVNGTAPNGDGFYTASSIQLNEAPQLFASTDNLNIGINSFALSKGINEDEESGVSLEVPANVTGEIFGELTWTLTAGPN